ncbi:hypothetical protein AALO_G00242970 [Alosa alosa]|uniref:Mitochondrial antiviral-signaling protein n=1 Tax=Alosa alosa TaxID=278164 RepID=A0AAV6FYQ2_9TELE|nr:translation initiation factor IF-2-like isoform X2 [Alosa alosa]KAG5265481.1 hypothetical protein AALO_G00242970 [Alosa alosa]
MPYASDKLYKEYVRRNMARFATQVKVREILPHLSCLTQTDREEVEAKREMTGNYNAMQLLIDNLKRRENWPEEFIRALEECEHSTLAQEMRDAYEALKQPKMMPQQAAGVSDSPGAVTTVHIHPPPPADSEPAQPPVPASSPSVAAAEPAAEPTAPAPVSSPEALVTPDVTSRPAPPSDVAADAAPAPESIPPAIAEVPEVPPTEEAQAPDLAFPLSLTSLTAPQTRARALLLWSSRSSACLRIHSPPPKRPL